MRTWQNRWLCLGSFGEVQCPDVPSARPANIPAGPAGPAINANVTAKTKHQRSCQRSQWRTIWRPSLDQYRSCFLGLCLQNNIPFGDLQYNAFCSLLWLWADCWQKHEVFCLFLNLCSTFLLELLQIHRGLLQSRLGLLFRILRRLAFFGAFWKHLGFAVREHVLST